MRAGLRGQAWPAAISAACLSGMSRRTAGRARWHQSLHLQGEGCNVHTALGQTRAAASLRRPPAATARPCMPRKQAQHARHGPRTRIRLGLGREGERHIARGTAVHAPADERGAAGRGQQRPEEPEAGADAVEEQAPVKLHWPCRQLQRAAGDALQGRWMGGGWRWEARGVSLEGRSGRLQARGKPGQCTSLLAPTAARLRRRGRRRGDRRCQQQRQQAGLVPASRHWGWL